MLLQTVSPFIRHFLGSPDTVEAQALAHLADRVTEVLNAADLLLRNMMETVLAMVINRKLAKHLCLN